MTSAPVTLLKTNGSSTDLYLRLLRNVGISSKSIPVQESAFAEINTLLPHPSEQLDKRVYAAVSGVNSPYLLVPNITLHETIDRLITAGHELPRVVHPYRLVLPELSHRDTVAILGSKYTMTSDYSMRWLEGVGCRIHRLPDDDLDFIDSLRRQVFQRGLDDDLVLAFRSYLSKATKGVVRVVACSELSLLAEAAGVPVVDMAMLQVNETARIIRGS